MRVFWKPLGLASHYLSTRIKAHGLPHLHVSTLSSLSCRTLLSPRQTRPSRSSFTMASNTRPEKVYFPNIDVENLEEYRIGGYHPTVIGGTFHEGRYEVVHKLGFGGYSTIWLARDRHLQRYVSLKILIARQVSESNEAKILRLLSGSSPEESAHPGQRFIPRLLDDFTFDGPNGRHLCLVQEFAACSITVAKEWSSYVHR